METKESKTCEDKEMKEEHKPVVDPIVEREGKICWWDAFIPW